MFHKCVKSVHHFCAKLYKQIPWCVTGCTVCSFGKHCHSISLTQVTTARTQLPHNSPGGNTNSQNRSHTNQNLRIDKIKGPWANPQSHKALSLFLCFSFQLVYIGEHMDIILLYSTFLQWSFAFSLSFCVFYHSTQELNILRNVTCCVYIVCSSC